MMAFADESLSDLSLQHVLEDGIALTKGQLSPEQRDMALEGILEVFSEASQGATIVHGNALFIRAEDKAAFDTFSLIFNYLNQAYGEELANQLDNAKAVFEQLSLGNEVSSNLLSNSSQLLQNFLNALRLHQRLSPPIAPHIFN